MPFINNPIPRAAQPFRHEQSYMRSIRDSDSPFLEYKRARTNAKQNQANGRALQLLQQQFNRIRRRVLPILPATPEFFHPFKIYQPSAPPIGYPYAITFKADGTPVQCIIGTVTDFTANPPTVNAADTWRFWAVRSGDVEIRTIYSYAGNLQVDNVFGVDSNFAKKFAVKNTDFGLPIYSQEYDSTQTTNGVVLVIPSNGKGGNGQPATTLISPQPNLDLDYNGSILFGIWLDVQQDSRNADGTTNPPSVTLKGWRFSLQPNDAYQNLSVPSGSNIIPVGIVATEGAGNATVSGAPYTFTVWQMLDGNVVNRYPPRLGSKLISTDVSGNSRYFDNCYLNYRGDWDLDADLLNQWFYPGDYVLKIVGSPQPAPGGGNYILQGKYLCVAPNLTLDPSQDADHWQLIEQWVGGFSP